MNTTIGVIEMNNKAEPKTCENCCYCDSGVCGYCIGDNWIITWPGEVYPSYTCSNYKRSRRIVKKDKESNIIQ